MTIKVLEHNGIFTAYRRVVKRTDDGQLYESLTRIDFPSPPPVKKEWGNWAVSLARDELEVGIQIYFDKWNFGNGADGERDIYELLYDEREARKRPEVVFVSGGSLNAGGVPSGSGGSNGASGAQGTLNFPAIKK